MKKFCTVLFIFMCFLFIGVKANAADPAGYIPHKIIVKFPQSFSSQNPLQTFDVVVAKTVNVQDSLSIREGTVVSLELVKINKENVGKQNASVVAKITKIYIPQKNKTIDVAQINPNAYVKFSQYDPLDYTQTGIDMGIKVVNKYVVKNIKYPAQFVKGAIYNESGNRLESGWKESFDSSPLSYATVGVPFILNAGDLATLTYYTKDAPQILDSAFSDNSETTSQMDAQ